jgi:TPR repeat protein
MRRWMKIANNNIGAARYNVGLMHIYGQGVSKDPNEAYKWFLLASVNRVSKGATALRRVSGRLTPFRITPGEDRAKKWLASRSN